MIVTSEAAVPVDVMSSFPLPPVIVAALELSVINVRSPVRAEASTVVATVLAVPASKSLEPETLRVVAAAAVRVPRVLSEPEETIFKVSIPAIVAVPPVTFERVRVAESAVPVTSPVAKANVPPLAVLDSVRPSFAAIPMFETVPAAVNYCL